MSITAHELLRSPAAADLARAYRARRQLIERGLDAAARSIPGLGSQLDEQGPEGYAQLWAQVDAAFAGDWEVLARGLRRTAAAYASSGASLEHWLRLAEIGTDEIHAELVQRHAADPPRLLAALRCMQRFFDLSYGVFHVAFLEASQVKLHESDALFRRLPVGLALMDGDTQLLRVNDAFLAMYGLTHEQARGTLLASLFDPESLARAREAYTEDALRSGTASYETVHVRHGGQRFPVLAQAVRLNEPGKSELWAVSIHDLTERRAAEALRARSTALELENAQVREASRVKSEFLANMSHELRTPLNSVLGFSELLIAGEVGPLAAQQLEFVQDIHSSGKHLLQLINDVLDLSKVEAGKMEFSPILADLEVVTREVVQIMRGTSLERRIHVGVDVDAGVRQARIDVPRFKQVLFNYLSNAIKFSPFGGLVEVRVRAEDAARFRLEVEDHGIGITPEDRARLFVVFEQLDAKNVKSQGTGLGLALVRRLVEAQGGSVGVESVPGQGSTFHAILPRELVLTRGRTGDAG